jgi:hypothetical protein
MKASNNFVIGIAGPLGFECQSRSGISQQLYPTIVSCPGDMIGERDPDGRRQAHFVIAANVIAY